MIFAYHIHGCYHRVVIHIKVLGQIMTMTEVVDLRKHNDIMSFVIQDIVNIHKANDLIIFFIDVNPTGKFRLIVETKFRLSSDET